MAHSRKRVRESFFEKLLQESLRIAFVSKALKTNQLKRIVVDTTVQPKAVAFPTDVGLMCKAITSLVDLAKKNSLDLRQTYECVVKRAAIKSGRYKSIDGDKINALLADIGYNFRLLLRWLRFFCFNIGLRLWVLLFKNRESGFYRFA